jgi:hypothetical protein
MHLKAKSHAAKLRVSEVQIPLTPPASIKGSGFSEEMSETTACSRLSLSSKDTGGSVVPATWGRKAESLSAL